MYSLKTLSGIRKKSVDLSMVWTSQLPSVNQILKQAQDYAVSFNNILFEI